jgi:hypothetical protein
MGSALTQLGPGGMIGLIAGIALGGWAIIKIGRAVMIAYFFAIFSLVGAVLVLGASYMRTGNAPEPATWVAASLAFGGVASAVRKKIARAVTLAAILGASYLFLGRPDIQKNAEPSKAPAHSKR